MKKIIIICSLIIILPFLEFIFRERRRIFGAVRYTFVEPFNKIANFPFRLRLQEKIENNASAREFWKVFENHFHPKTGAFSVVDLRVLVHKTYAKEMKKCENFKTGYRLLSSKFYPDHPADDFLSKEHREVLTDYFFKHFPKTEKAENS